MKESSLERIKYSFNDRSKNFGGFDANKWKQKVMSSEEYEKWYFNERQKKSWHDHENDDLMGFGQQTRGNDKITLPHPLGSNMRAVWTISTSGFGGEHFACYPEDLVERCIKAGCPKEGIVLDPYSGSGTTAVVAKRLGRKYLGIELNESYVKMSELRIKGFKDWQEYKKVKEGKQKTL